MKKNKKKDHMFSNLPELGLRRVVSIFSLPSRVGEGVLIIWCQVKPKKTSRNQILNKTGRILQENAYNPKMVLKLFLP